jgi:hypothetical protein
MNRRGERGADCSLPPQVNSARPAERDGHYEVRSKSENKKRNSTAKSTGKIAYATKERRLRAVFSF